MKILTEASGSMTAAYMIRAIQSAGHEAVASDIIPDIAARKLADEFVKFPVSSDPTLWDKVPALLIEHGIDLVIPSLDETLAGWAERRNALQVTANCHVIISK